MLARMSTDALAPATGLTSAVASEIRAQLGRQSISRSELARRLDVDDTWVGKRLNGHTEISLTDLERIAAVLRVTVVDLFPRDRRRVTETYLRDAVTPTPARAMNTRPPHANRRPSDLRPVGRPSTSSRPNGSRRTNRVA